MNIFVTGGHGFVGKHIIENLKKDHHCFSPSRLELDLRNLNDVNKFFQENSIDVVIHCALSGRENLNSEDPIYLVDGLLMFRNLWLNKKYFKKLINLGTMYEYNQYDELLNIDDDENINYLPISSYAFSKNIISRIIKDTPNFYNLRLFGVFHEDESEKRFFKKVISQDEIVIDYDRYVDFIYLTDIIPMIKTILSTDIKYQNINMVYEQKYKLSELCYILCDYLNLDKNKIKIKNHNGNSLTGKSQRLQEYQFDLIGIKNGLQKYKK